MEDTPFYLSPGRESRRHCPAARACECSTFYVSAGTAPTYGNNSGVGKCSSRRDRYPAQGGAMVDAMPVAARKE